MKKIIIPVLLTVLLAGCGNAGTEAAGTVVAPGTGLTGTEASDTEETSEIIAEASSGDYPQYIMVNGVVYMNSGRTSSALRCGMMDGSLTEIDKNEIPSNDGEANFGGAEGWQYGREQDTIEVSMEGEWFIFVVQPTEKEPSSEEADPEK